MGIAEIFEISALSDWTLLLVRITLFTVMIYYGLPKIRDLKKNAEDFTSMGFSPGMFWGTIIALVETVGVFLILIGVFAELFAVLLAVEMILGTLWKIKVKKPFTDFSYDILVAALALVILSFGSGSYALASIPY